jgi:NAD+-dependent protein deacetylase sirtuin 4
LNVLPSSPPSLDALLELLRSGRVVILSGAGCSTESGIPDYRGPQGRLRPRSPIQYGEFVRDPGARIRYWARSAVGWPRFRAALPNAAHRALARLEEGGVVRGVITQNVDGLHHAAGSGRVIELHGSLAFVRCLACGGRTRRDAFQERLLALNGAWLERRSGGVEAEPAPDGDAELLPSDLDGFRVPGCEACGGVVKPDVVLFGESVPRECVEGAWGLFEEARVVLVVGSSLAVFSGRRFVLRAEKEGVPVAIVNLGPTRADDVAAAKVEGRLGDVLPRVADALVGERERSVWR